MKKTLLLLLSIAGNVMLLALVFSSTSGTKLADDDRASASNQSPSASSAGKNGAAGAIDTSDVPPALWKKLSDGDLPAQVARLKEAGFPDSVVRMIISAQLSEQYQDRQSALRAGAPNTPYWQNESAMDPQIRAAQRELSSEYTKQMTDLLGTAMPIDDPLYRAQQRRQFGDLPREKIDQIERIRRDYSDLQQQALEAARGGASGPITITGDIQTRLNLLEKEQRADILALLTPQEAEDYELRTGNTANQMRSQLASFNPTEAEFRAIHKLRSVFDEQYNLNSIVRDGNNAATQDLMRQRTEAEKQLNAQIKGMLGEQRGADYERAVDGNFQTVYRVVERLQLPQETAVAVWTTQKEIQDRTNALRTDRTLTPAARSAQMGALAQEASTRVSAALGDRGYEVYKQYGGSWIQSLEQQAAAAAGRPAAGAPGAAGGRGGGGAVGGSILRMDGPAPVIRTP